MMRKDTLFADLVTAISEMAEHMAGNLDLPEERIHFVGEPDPREVRRRLGLSQKDFAEVLGVSVRTVQNWEQGRRQPSGPAMKLLKIASNNPELLLQYS